MITIATFHELKIICTRHHNLMFKFHSVKFVTCFTRNHLFVRYVKKTCLFHQIISNNNNTNKKNNNDVEDEEGKESQTPSRFHRLLNQNERNEVPPSTYDSFNFHRHSYIQY